MLECIRAAIAGKPQRHFSFTSLPTKCIRAAIAGKPQRVVSRGGNSDSNGSRLRRCWAAVARPWCHRGGAVKSSLRRPISRSGVWLAKILECFGLDVSQDGVDRWTTQAGSAGHC